MCLRTGEASANAPPKRTLEEVLRIGREANVGLNGNPDVLLAEANDATIGEKLKELVNTVYNPPPPHRAAGQACSRDPHNTTLGHFIPEQDKVQLHTLQKPVDSYAVYTVAFRYAFREFKFNGDQQRAMDYRLVLNGKDTSLTNSVDLGARSQPHSKERVLEEVMVSYSPRFWRDLLKKVSQ